MVITQHFKGSQISTKKENVILSLYEQTPLGFSFFHFSVELMMMKLLPGKEQASVRYSAGA